MKPTRRETFGFDEANSDWHSIWSITLGELEESGFDPFGDPDWTTMDWYDDETRTRWEHKFTRWYRQYEIGIMPPLAWRDMLTSRMMGILPKYKQAYKALADGVDMRAISDDYYKGRNVFSDFPATQLNPDNQDYASNATDNEWEHVTDGDWIDYMRRLGTYNDVDVAIIEELGDLFSVLGTVSEGW